MSTRPLLGWEGPGDEAIFIVRDKVTRLGENGKVHYIPYMGTKVQFSYTDTIEATAVPNETDPNQNTY